MLDHGIFGHPQVHGPDWCSGVVRLQEDLERVVSLTGGILTENMRREAKGISALFCNGKKRGFAASSDTSAEGLAHVFDAAAANYALTGNEKRTTGRDSSAFVRLPGSNDTLQEQLIDQARNLDAMIQKLCPQIVGRKVRIHTLSTEKELRAFSGAQCHIRNPRTNIYITLTAKGRDGNGISLSDSLGGIGFFDDVFSDLSPMEQMIRDLYEDLMQKCTPVEFAEGAVDTVMSDCTGILIHEAFGHMAEGDSVLEGSVLKGRMGDMVAATMISASDFAASAFGGEVPQTLLLDDEGTVCKDAPLITNGILTGYMTDIASAEALGCAQTGNARAATYADEPVVRMRNTAIHPGNSSLEEMIRATEHGIYIKRTGGGQADMTGRYLFKIQTAYRIENGKLLGALRDFSCTGNSFETLRNVSMVGNMLSWRHSSLCGKQMQTIAVGMTGPAIKTITQIVGG